MYIYKNKNGPNLQTIESRYKHFHPKIDLCRLWVQNSNILKYSLYSNEPALQHGFN